MPAGVSFCFVVRLNSAAVRHENGVAFCLRQQRGPYPTFGSSEDDDVHRLGKGLQAAVGFRSKYLTLAQFQSNQRYNGQHNAHNPEARHDFGFVVAQLLVVVVQRRHAQQAAALAVLAAWCT